MKIFILIQNTKKMLEKMKNLWAEDNSGSEDEVESDPDKEPEVILRRNGRKSRKTNESLRGHLFTVLGVVCSCIRGFFLWFGGFLWPISTYTLISTFRFQLLHLLFLLLPLLIVQFRQSLLITELDPSKTTLLIVQFGIRAALMTGLLINSPVQKFINSYPSCKSFVGFR